MENNNQDIKLCLSCGAKNKAAYKFCNECGAELNQTSYANSAPVSDTDNQYQNPQGTANGYYGSQPNYSDYSGTQPNANGYTGNYGPYGFYANQPYMNTPDFNGVSAKDLYEFSGEKPQFFEKLCQQHFTGKNGPFCWPLFILGILLGFFGMGCWYLYHKMYKPAAAFFAATVVQISLSVYFVVEFLKEFSTIMSSGYLDGMLEEYGTQIPPEIFSSFGMNMLVMEGVSNIISIVMLVLTIALPFYAYKQYKNFALNKIRSEYQKGFQPNLRFKGGTNGVAVVLASVLYGISVIALVISMVIGCVSFVFQNIDNFPNGSNYNEYYEDWPYGDFDY